MGYVYTKDLVPGMITNADVYNFNDQLIIPSQTTLTDSLISHLEYYSIPKVRVAEDSASDKKDDSISYSEKIMHSDEFKDFHKNFIQNIDALESSISKMIKEDTSLDEIALLTQTNKLIPENTTTIGIFDMIHNMRQYDDSTYAHCINVSLICGIMGKWLHLSEEDENILIICGLLHDIGKLTIPDNIIKKSSRLTKEEFDIMKSHSLRGYELLKKQNIDKRIKNAALMHHERCDGSGYPNALTSNQIDDFAKIVTIADVYEAMTASRVYRSPQCPFQVISIFEEEGLQKYDPHYILTFLKRIVSSYMNNNVRLSDGRIGEVIMINQTKLSRPVVRIGNEYIDLSSDQELSIVEIV